MLGEVAYETRLFAGFVSFSKSFPLGGPPFPFERSRARLFKFGTCTYVCIISAACFVITHVRAFWRLARSERVWVANGGGSIVWYLDICT